MHAMSLGVAGKKHLKPTGPPEYLPPREWQSRCPWPAQESHVRCHRNTTYQSMFSDNARGKMVVWWSPKWGRPLHLRVRCPGNSFVLLSFWRRLRSIMSSISCGNTILIFLGFPSLMTCLTFQLFLTEIVD